MYGRGQTSHNESCKCEYFHKDFMIAIIRDQRCQLPKCVGKTLVCLQNQLQVMYVYCDKDKPATIRLHVWNLNYLTTTLVMEIVDGFRDL